WIPMDKKLWEIDNYSAFLAARRALLAAEANKRLAELLHGDMSWLEGAPAAAVPDQAATGGISSEQEEAELEAINEWVAAQGLPRGEIAFDYADPETGQQKAVFDIAWPLGL